jgi:SAM-dependent methyltransferase
VSGGCLIGATATDWKEWHAGYDGDGSLGRRLEVVRRRIVEVLEGLTGARILSLCAGDGRDVLPVCAQRGGDHEVFLVDMDPQLATGAAQRARRLGLTAVHVMVADAGAPAAYRRLLPVDLLLLCGVFGNISDGDVRRTMQAARAMLAPGGAVIWTRGGSDPDPRPTVRRWFQEAGFEELAFDGAPEHYGVGLSRLRGETVSTERLPEQLFEFIR